MADRFRWFRPPPLRQAKEIREENQGCRAAQTDPPTPRKRPARSMAKWMCRSASEPSACCGDRLHSRPLGCGAAANTGATNHPRRLHRASDNELPFPNYRRWRRGHYVRCAGMQFLHRDVVLTMTRKAISLASHRSSTPRIQSGKRPRVNKNSLNLVLSQVFPS